MRVLLPTARPLPVEPDRFKWAMRWLQRDFPFADKACVDAARYYFPGREVVSMHVERPLDVPEPPTMEEIIQSHARRGERARRNFDLGIYPRWVRDFLINGVEVGQRRKKIYAVAAALARLNVDDATIETYILKSPIPVKDLNLTDLRRQISNGIKCGIRERIGQKEEC